MIEWDLSTATLKKSALRNLEVETPSASSVQKFSCAELEQISLQLILDEPPELIMNQWIKSRVEYYKRLEPTDAVRDVALALDQPNEIKISARLCGGMRPTTEFPTSTSQLAGGLSSSANLLAAARARRPDRLFFGRGIFLGFVFLVCFLLLFVFEQFSLLYAAFWTYT